MIPLKRFFVGLCLISSQAQADVSCIGIHSTNPETFTLEQHPVNYLNCPCNCSQYTWIDNGRCITCNHKHGDAQVIQTAKTNGNFITFMPPSEAKTAVPSGDTSWFSRLAAKVKAQNPTSRNSKHFSESNKL